MPCLLSHMPIALDSAQSTIENLWAYEVVGDSTTSSKIYQGTKYQKVVDVEEMCQGLSS
jgi:hypothetical protein